MIHKYTCLNMYLSCWLFLGKPSNRVTYMPNQRVVSPKPKPFLNYVASLVPSVLTWIGEQQTNLAQWHHGNKVRDGRWYLAIFWATKLTGFYWRNGKFILTKCPVGIPLSCIKIFLLKMIETPRKNQCFLFEVRKMVPIFRSPTAFRRWALFGRV